MNETSTTVARLFATAETVWRNYCELGPGKVSAELFDDVETAVNAALQAAGGDAQIEEPAEILRDLCHRCCCRSEGLCFITGEAGLIPRRDLHDRFEEALQALRAVVETEGRRESGRA